MNNSTIQLNFYCFILIFLQISGCEWPFNTNATDEDIFELTLNHNIVRIMPSAQVLLLWDEITVENFKNFQIERKTIHDTTWTEINKNNNQFQTTYVDTIWDDDDLIYRIGIVDMDDNVIWATTSIVIPKTTSVFVPDEFKTIQPAFVSKLIDDGDTIIVKAGSYHETLGIGGKDVLITAVEGYKETILLPTRTNDPNIKERVLFISSGILQGFTIKEGAPSHGKPGGGIYIGQAGTVRNCKIYENVALNGGGVYITNGGNLYNNIISNNLAGAKGKGIYVGYGHGEIVNNTIFGNDIYINGDCSGLLLRNNIIHSSNLDISFANKSSQSGVTIDYSLLKTDAGIGSNIILENPKFLDYIDFKLLSVSPCIDAGHPGDQYLDNNGTRNDIGAYGGPGGGN